MLRTEEKLQRARVAKALRVAQGEEAMLGSFIRLVDYMCVQSVAIGIANKLHAFLQELNGAVQQSALSGLPGFRLSLFYIVLQLGAIRIVI